MRMFSFKSRQSLPPSRYKYEAFISYKRSFDDRIAASLQSALHRFARPWYKVRTLRVFRDRTDLSINYALGSSLEQALDQSEHLILLACEQAAESEWVRREIEHWLARRSVEQLLIILTAGDIVWDRQAGDFDWQRTTALPEILRAKFKEEPFYLDLRKMRNEDVLSMRHPQFKESVAELAAALLKKEKSEILGEDIRQYRRNIRIAIFAGVFLAVMSLVTTLAAYTALAQRDIAREQRGIAEANLKEALRQRSIADANLVEARQQKQLADQNLREAQRQETIARANFAEAESQRKVSEERRLEAERQGQIALARQLAAQSEVVRGQQRGMLQRSLSLALESYRILPTLEADQSVRRSLALLPARIYGIQHEEGIERVRFSEMRNVLVVAGADKALHVYDAATGQERKRIAYGVQARDIAISGNGKYFSVLGVMDRRTVDVFDIESGKRIVSVRHEKDVNDTSFSPDGASLATTGDDRMVCLWEIPTGRKLASSAHPFDPGSVVFSPDGKRLAIASKSTFSRTEGSVLVLDRTLNRVLSRLPYQDYVRALAFSPEGGRLAVSGGIGQLSDLPVANNARPVTLVFNLETGEEMLRIVHESVIHELAFNENGNSLATASQDRTASVWDLMTGRELIRMVHDGPVRTVAFGPGANSIATGGNDGMLQLWEVKSAAAVAHFQKGMPIVSADFSLDGRHLVTAGGYTQPRNVIGATFNDTTIQLWSLEKGSPVNQVFYDSAVNKVMFSPSGKSVVTAHRNGIARVLDARSGKKLVEVKHSDNVWSVALSPDERLLATASKDRTAKVWEIATGKEVGSFSHAGDVVCVSFSRDGLFLATGGRDRIVRVWRVSDGGEVSQLVHQGPVYEVAFTADGAGLATASEDGAVRLWDLRKNEIRREFRHEGPATSLAFSPDGLHLATASEDRTARIWSMASGREVARVLHEGPINSVVFSRDGRYWATTSGDRSARVWLWRPEDLIEASCSRLSRNLTPKEWGQYVSDRPPQKTCEQLR